MNTVHLTTLSIDEPPATSTAFMFSSAWVAWAAIPSGTVPVAGLRPVCSGTKMNPLARIPARAERWPAVCGSNNFLCHGWSLPSMTRGVIVTILAARIHLVAA